MFFNKVCLSGIWSAINLVAFLWRRSSIALSVVFSMFLICVNLSFFLEGDFNTWFSGGVSALFGAPPAKLWKGGVVIFLDSPLPSLPWLNSSHGRLPSPPGLPGALPSVEGAPPPSNLDTISDKWSLSISALIFSFSFCSG